MRRGKRGGGRRIKKVRLDGKDIGDGDSEKGGKGGRWERGEG